jgi:GNAT superfamily N-acetyltransferase
MEDWVSRRLASLTLDNLDDLPRRCRRCVFWELDPLARDVAEEAGDVALEKEAWVSATLLEWGSCGKLLYVDSTPAGYLLYAPPAYVPRSVAFPTSPVSGDAVLLMTGRVIAEFQGGGLGRMLLQAAAKDLTRRGVRAIEAFGSLVPPGNAGDPEDAPDAKRRPPGSCVVPADFLLAVGFKTVRPHYRYPRLRLDLKNALSWREDVEVALERLLGSMNPEPVFRPV